MNHARFDRSRTYLNPTLIANDKTRGQGMRYGLELHEVFCTVPFVHYEERGTPLEESGRSRRNGSNPLGNSVRA
jgi:hypothetical protein